jgi:peptide/nickel transport system permease protein
VGPYLLRRLAAVLPVLAVVVTVVFLLIHLIPGDPVSVMLGPDATPSQIEATRKGLGLDRPIYEQLIGFYTRILRGDLGQSYFLDRPVSQALWERAEPTLVLMLAALLVAVAIGVPSGTIAAAYRGSAWDRGLMLISLLGVCIPGFWLSLNFIYFFAVRLGWLPAAGYVSVFTDPVGAMRYMVLPAFSLGFNQSALIARIARSCMLEVLQQDYIRTARAKGLAERLVVIKHAFRNACIPVITVLGLQFGQLLGGAIITETVFAWPGVATLTVESIRNQDFPVVQCAVVLLALIIVSVNFLVDMIVGLIDPRIRVGA